MNLFFPFAHVYLESSSVNKAFAIFLPINFLHLTESIMLEPEIHSIIFTILYTIAFCPLVIIFDKFSFTNMFFFTGALNSFFANYLISFFTKKEYEKVIKLNKDKNNSKKEILHCLNDPIALYNDKLEVCFSNHEFQKLNINEISNHNSNSDLIEILKDENNKTLKQHLGSMFKENISSIENCTKVFSQRNPDNHLGICSFMISFIIKHFKSLNSFGIAIIIKNVGNEIEIRILNKINNFTKMMLYSMSHEIRTPINGMIGVLHLLKKKVDKNLRTLIQIGIACSAFLTSQIDSIMDFAQIIKGEFEIHGSYFNIRRFINQIYKISLKYLDEKSKKISLVINIDSQISNEIYGDQPRIQQILMNLLFNSIKYTDVGSITITVKKIDKNWIQFSIIDTGSGFTNEQINILNNYKQNEFEVIYNELNTFPGFKLSISQMILSKYCSQLKAHLKESKGSHLSFLVPQLYAQQSIKFESRSLCKELTIYPVSSNYEKYKNPLNPQTLTFIKLQSSKLSFIEIENFKIALIVDDIDMNRFVLSKLVQLTKNDIFCLEAKNGLEALQLTKKYYEEKKIIIFMDIEMPIMNGIEASQEIRKFSKAPIIAITAYTSEEIRKKALDAGINMVLNKPVSIHQIKEILLLFGF